MRTANPALNAKTFSRTMAVTRDESMTVQGTASKTLILLVLAMIPAAWVWNQVFSQPVPSLEMVSGYMLLGVFGGLIAALITIFKQTWAPVTAPIYAVLEGFFLGGISSVFEVNYPGIVPQAVGLTFGTLAVLLFVYKTGIVKATENFKMGVVAATGGIALFYFASLILGFFGISMPLIHSSGTFGILFSLFVVVIAALNLVLDFDFIETGAERGAPKYMEWYGAFGLMVTLVWLYIEILRLLSKLSSRR